MEIRNIKFLIPLLFLQQLILTIRRQFPGNQSVSLEHGSVVFVRKDCQKTFSLCLINIHSLLLTVEFTEHIYRN